MTLLRHPKPPFTGRPTVLPEVVKYNFEKLLLTKEKEMGLGIRGTNPNLKSV